MLENANNYCVIMAGGVGSRFWPFSRNSKPKQFLDFFGTGRSLLQMTIDRFRPISRKVTFAKVWSRMDIDWQYLVKDGEYTPQFVYGERQVVSAIMEISGQ